MALVLGTVGQKLESLQKTIRETKKDLEEAVSEGLNASDKNEEQEKGIFLCSDRKFGNTVTCINGETRKSTQGNCECLGKFEAKFQTLSGFLPAAYDTEEK